MASVWHDCLQSDRMRWAAMGSRLRLGVLTVYRQDCDCAVAAQEMETH